MMTVEGLRKILATLPDQHAEVIVMRGEAPTSMIPSDVRYDDDTRTVYIL